MLLSLTPYTSSSLLILAMIQVAMMGFHGGSVFISVNSFSDKLNHRSQTILRSFCICNVLCFGWRGFLFLHMSDTGQDLPFYTQIVSPFLVAVTFVHLWFLVPLLTKLPTIEQLQNLNEQLADKILELEQEKKEKEKAQKTLVLAQKMEAVGQLTGGIAHDFNNLLMAISGNLELIKRNPQSAKLEKWIGTGIDAVARAAHLTAQLLTFSRVQKLQMKEVELKPLLVGRSEMFRLSVGTDIDLRLGHIDNVVIKTDPVQLGLAILNLLNNGRDAIVDKGAMTLSTCVVGEMVEIYIDDTGSGIAEQISARIFEPFFTTKDVGKGTGLGLSMVYGVATQSGGDVYVKQTSPQGTTFAITLPIIPQVQIDNTDERVYDLSAQQTKDILIVDDDRAVRETLTEILTHLGHRVHEVESGSEALLYLSTNKPDLMLIDFLMPVMNGAQLSEKVQILHPGMSTVFVTGFSDSACLENQTVLKKPFKIDDIQQLFATLFV